MQHPVIVRRANSRLQAMASQVKEVLPHVPMATIISDLGISLKFIATILMNLLDKKKLLQHAKPEGNLW